MLRLSTEFNLNPLSTNKEDTSTRTEIRHWWKVRQKTVKLRRGRSGPNLGKHRRGPRDNMVFLRI